MSTPVEEFKKYLRDSFPLSAPFKIDELEFAKSYIETMREWATENLGVKPFKEEVKVK